MISLPAGSRIWLVAGITDMRNGFNGLASKVQNVLKDDPFSGHLFIFRGRRGDQIKVLWADSDGLCLFTKRLERGRFVWPVTRDGKVHLTPAQLSMLLEGIDWKHPKPSRQPSGCGLSWPVITVIKTDNVIVFQVVIWPVQLNLANKNPADNLPAQPPCYDGGWSPAPGEQIMKPGCFFPTSPALPITVWRKIFRTCLKKMPAAIMKQLYG